MTEHTDKSPQKPGRRPPRKRPGKAPSPEGKRAMSPGANPARPAEAAPSAATGTTPRSPLAPDPATVVFGSSRPIAAQPPKLPESSGLRFSGPSAGVLKASGPQPTSPKAGGLTFTAAKATPPKPAAPAKPAPAKKLEAKKPEATKPEATKPEADKPALTKPAIAPQASGRRLEKERSTGGFLSATLLLAVLGGGLAFWMQPSSETIAPQEAAAPHVAAPASAEVSEPAVVPDPPVPAAALPAPETPGPLARGDGGDDGLSAAEIGEIQVLLSRLDLDPGSEHGTLTPATAAAIRSYQEMAGLLADGEADRALLEELRSVAELYGS